MFIDYILNEVCENVCEIICEVEKDLIVIFIDDGIKIDFISIKDIKFDGCI